MSGIEIASGLLNDFTDSKVKELLDILPWMRDKQFSMLTKQLEIEAYVDLCIEKGLTALDFETTGLNNRLNYDGKPSTDIVGVCLSCDVDVGVYIPVAHVDDEYNVPLNIVLRNLERLAANCVLVFHNFKFDGEVLRNHGIFVDDEDKYEDTLIMAHIEDASRKQNNLKELSRTILGRPQLKIEDLGVQGNTKKIVAFQMVPPQKALYYGAPDAMNTLALYHEFKKRIDKMDPTGKAGPKFIYKVEKRAMFVTMEMERNLVLIDKEYLIEKREEVRRRMKKIKGDIFKLAGRPFDINSAAQIGTILFDELKIKYPEKEKTKTGQYITNEKTLQKIQDDNPIVDLILTYRGYEKLVGTYIENLINNCDETNHVKFQLNQTRADTGRYTASGGKGLEIDGYSGVNCQNIPGYDPEDPHAVDLRRAVIAHPGFKILSIDYSGEELRIAANFSREPLWLREFLEGTGDLHTITGKIITGKKQISKKERSLGKCVAKGTLVATERGWIPIEGVKKGDRVVTHTGALKKVESVHFMGHKIAKAIETKTGHRIVCGYNHRFLTVGDEWVRAEDLEIGQKIKTVSCAAINPKKLYRTHFNFWDKGNNNFSSDALPYIEINYHWAKLLGYLLFLGDGHIHPYYAGIVCSPKYEDVKEDFMATAEALGLPCNAVLKHRKGAKNPLWTINVGSTIFSRFCKHLGFRGRRGKVFRVPDSIYESPKEVSKGFLQGLFETDDTVDGLVSLCTKDKDLAYDVVLLLASFGIKAYVYIKPSKKYKRDYYQVQMGKLGAQLFEKEIGFISRGKRERLKKLCSRSQHPGALREQKWETEVKSIESIEKEELWDLTVADDHTYVAQGLVTHNTLNFLTMYGGGAGGFAAQAKVPYETAKRMLMNFFREYKGLKKWIDSEIANGKKRGYSQTAFGRRRPLTEYYSSSDKGIQAKGDRCVVNSAIQGCLQGHERVLTSKGYIPILELRNMPVKELSGLKIYTGTGWETFDVVDRGKARYAKLELANGMVLNCDTRHEVLVVGENGYEFRHYDDLDENTLVCTSIPVEQDFGVYPDPVKLDGVDIESSEQWNLVSYLLGYVLNDKHTTFLKEDTVKIKFSKRADKDLSEVLKKSLKSIGLEVVSMREGEAFGVSYYETEFFCSELLRLFSAAGFAEICEGKVKMPEILYRAPIGMRQAFIRGFCNTYAYIEDNFEYRLKPTLHYEVRSDNVEFFRAVQLIGWSIGQSSYVEPVDGTYRFFWEDLIWFRTNLSLPRSRKPLYKKYSMDVPEFLRNKVIESLSGTGCATDRTDRPMLGRLRKKENVGMKTVVRLLEKYGCEEPGEVYYHYALKSKKALDTEENTYTLSVHSPLHRFDSAGIISKNTGADILKIVMHRVSKWIKDNGLQDDVRMLMPIHDEIVYEVRESKMDWIIPELCEVMKIKDVIQALGWKVLLEVDAEYGDSLSVDHDYWKEQEEKMKESSEEVPEKGSDPEEPSGEKQAEKPDIEPSVSDVPAVVEDRPVDAEATETSSESNSYYRNVSVKSMLAGEAKSSSVEQSKSIISKSDQACGKNVLEDAHIPERVDEQGFFNYPIDSNLVTAQKIRFILQTLNMGGDFFIGPKHKLCLLSEDGEVYYKSAKPVSVDAFLAMCLVFNI